MSLAVHRPVPVKMPAWGVVLAESVHAPTFQMADRAEPFHKLVCVHAGELNFTARQPPADPLRLPAGSWLAIEQGCRHRFDDIHPTTLWLICLARDWIEQDAHRHAAWQLLRTRRQPHLQPDLQVRRQLDRLLRRMLAEQLRAAWGHPLALQADALRLLVELARLPDGPVATNAAHRVAAVLARLRETFYEPWTLDEAAEQAQLSRRRFTHLFTQACHGRTFLEELTRLRLCHAAQLLRQAHHSIAAAAFSSGFNDLSHFYRLFRKQFGRAPGAWREHPEKNIHRTDAQVQR